MSIQIKCHGEFYSRDGQLKLVRPFDEVVNAPSLSFFTQTAIKYTGTDDAGKLTFRESSFVNVRGVLKKKLLPLILGKKFPGQFVRVRLVTIDEITSTDNEALDLSINLMSINQLAHLIKQRNMPINAGSYVNVDELRTDVMEYMEDPEVFKRNYESKNKKRREELEFMRLNNLMPSDNAAPSPTEPKAKKSVSDIVNSKPY